MSEPEPHGQADSGAVAPDLAAEFPGLMLRHTTVHTRGGPSPGSLRARLRALADRSRGARVVAMRTQPVAHAYRAFYRQTGLDPDVTRIPSEQAAVARLLHGGYPSAGRIADALLVALVETGVPVRALAGETVQRASLGIRTARAGEAVAGGGPIGEGHLVIADAQRVHGPLFSSAAPAGAAPGPGELVLVSVGVDGVPAIFLDEALWLCAEALGDG